MAWYYDGKVGRFNRVDLISRNVLVKIIAWDNNEWDYCNRLVEMVQVVHK
ncbi:hypothetical protein HOL24_14345 [bacterium]|mgnify:FL=1|nr:hypothetical protein [bacterium]